MWRQNTCTTNPDSDQSISDEEEFEREWPENCISIGGAVENKGGGGLQISSKLQILRGIDDIKREKEPSSPKKKMRFALEMEDEVEMLASEDEGHFHQSPKTEPNIYSDEEMISEDDANDALANYSRNGARNFKNNDFHSNVSETQDVAHSWSAINKETEALVRLHEHASCSLSGSAYSKSNKHSEGGRGRIKPKLSFRFRYHKGELSRPCVSKEENIVSSDDEIDVVHKIYEAPQLLELMKRKSIEHPKHESCEHLQDEKKNQREIYKVPEELESHRHTYTEHSMAELLGGLQDDTGLFEGRPKLDCRKNQRDHDIKIGTSTFGGSFDNEDPPEPIGSGSSSDNEITDQKLKFAISVFKGQTIADLFQEALGTASLNHEGSFFAAPRAPMVGLFGKLQQVMQTEKETDAEFLKILQNGPSPNAICTDVKILSRFLDAKMIVCRCYVSKDRELAGEVSKTISADQQMSVTVVFNPRLCCNVELEIGNLIRIHSPWKKITAIGDDECAILSTYYSHILL